MLEFTGFWMALAIFFGIWCGHVGVRWLEARSPSIWPPIVVLLAAGIALHIYSLFAASLVLSGVASIIGVTLLWDAFEMYRQQKRVIKGHAPANPNNPRHAAYLAAGYGTTEDLLDREPQGVPVAGSTGEQAASSQQVRVASVRRERQYEEVEV
jgi:hypothetical protein